MSEKFIIRRKQESNFTTIPNAMIEDPKLSWKAKGILTYLLGRITHWRAQVEDIAKHSTDKSAAVRSALAELRSAGYARLEKRCRNGKIEEWVMLISDEPEFEKSDAHVIVNLTESDTPEVDCPHVENPHVETPQVINRHLSNTKGSKTGTSNNGSTLVPAIAETVDKVKNLPDPRIKIFTELWCSNYEEVFGRKYKHGGAKDTQATKRLLASTGFDITTILHKARLAWNKSDQFNSKQSVTICGFDSRFNDIMAELTPTVSSKPAPPTMIDKEIARLHRMVENL